MRFRISRFMSVVSQAGSDLRILISLFGICFFASLVIHSVMLFAYSSISSLFIELQSISFKSREKDS